MALKWPRWSCRELYFADILGNSQHDDRGHFKAIYDHLEAFGTILKPLSYVKLNSKHILLVKDFPKMPLNGHKWPWNGRGGHAARCSSKSEWITYNTHIVKYHPKLSDFYKKNYG